MSRGTAGYAEDAAVLLARYEALTFESVHAATLHLLPTERSHILDIGAGSGRDAAWLARAGHHVVAVEPTAEFREAAAVLHREHDIEWIDDSLPDLAALRDRRGGFDRVMITAVWMHLDEADRRRAMPVVAQLLAPGGIATLSLRHGPAPANRRVFDVSAEETIAIANAAGLVLMFDARTPSAGAANQDAAVTWTHLAFQKPA